jgi:hypothetical protein
MTTEDELMIYAKLDGTEWGETMDALCHLAGYKSYISEKLGKMLTKEISDNLKYAKKHCKIVETVETRTVTIKEIEWSE